MFENCCNMTGLVLGIFRFDVQGQKPAYVEKTNDTSFLL
jgi:hypothetical protein